MLKRLLLSLLLFTAVLNATQPTYENVTKLYVAMFNRAPDACGLYYWLNVPNFTLEEMAANFFKQPETKEKYPSSLTCAEFVETVYANLFNRAPDPSGLAYWVDALESGSISRSLFILAVINGAQGADAVILANKTEVGLYFATRGHCSIDASISVMADVTEDHTTVMDAITEINQLAPDCDVVIDVQTGLMWQNDHSPRKTWPAAVDYCSNEVSLCKGTDWRLPTTKELQSIIDTKNIPTILSIFDGNCDKALYWSSEGTSDRKDIVLFADGSTRYNVRPITLESSVRCVRGKSNTSTPTLKQTGQKKSYDVDGREVTHGTVKDDGFYQAGIKPNYTSTP